MFTYLLWPISYLLYLIGVRFLPIIHYTAIGHLAVEPDCYVKEGALGLRPNYLAVMLAPAHKVANRHLLDYWRQYIRVITSPVLCALLYPLARAKILQYDVARYVMNIHETALYFEINAKCADKPPTLILRESDRKRGWDCLRKLGVPEGAWFVCVHCREPGFRPHADHRHHHRNSDIETYRLAMEAIIERGGWCIRMGSSRTKPLRPMKNVIDYAHSSVRSDWMDVFLSASCKFFLGSCSGLHNVPPLFGVPCALVNLVPMSLLPPRHIDIGIPKLIWSRGEGRYLTFPEILSSPIGDFQISDLYVDAGVEVVDNAPEDIRDLVLEMLNVMEGTVTYTAEDESLQERFKSLLQPGHYSYGASSRLGQSFLRKYKNLLSHVDEST